MDTQSSYLKKLKFDPKLNDSLISKYISNFRLLILLLISVIGLGIFSFLTLPRVLNPQINIPIVIISSVLPGANPSDIESLVTVPIENAIGSVDEVRSITSMSRDSVSVVQVEFSSGVNADEARTNIQSAVDTAELPEDAQNPSVQKLDFENQPVWSFVVTNRSDDVASLIRFSKSLDDRLSELTSVDEVQTSGIEEQEIQIVLRPETISSYGINLQQVSQAISSTLNAAPAGIITTDTSSFSLSIDPASASVEDIRRIRLNVNGSIVQIGEIAHVLLRSKPDQNVTYFATPSGQVRNAVNFSVFRNTNVNIDKTIEDITQEIEQLQEMYPGQFQIQTVLNTAEEINEQFSDLTRDFSITIALMFVILLIFLGIRQAVVSSLTIPLTFSISFTVMLITGITLNFISLFSLLLSLGLLVDDAIVVISAISAYHRTGKFTPKQAGLLVWRDFLIAIFTTTITTVWAFLPLALSSGIIGEFIKPIPIVVSTTLLASFLVALLITLPLMIFLLKPEIPRRVKVLLQILSASAGIALAIFIIPKDILFIPTLALFLMWIGLTFWLRTRIASDARNSLRRTVRTPSAFRSKLSNGFIRFDAVAEKYKNSIRSILKSRSNKRLTIVMVIVFSVFSYLLLPLGFVQNEFFPRSDQDYLYISVELPPGTNLETSKHEARKLTNELKEIHGVEYITADTSRAFTSMGQSRGETNNLLLSIVLEEGVSSIDLAANIRSQYNSYSTGKLSVTELTGGPPAGADLQIKLFGEDLQELNRYAGQIQAFLDQQAGVINIDQTVKSGTSKIVFIPDQQKLAENNVTQDQLGFWLRSYASGFTVDTVQFANMENDDTDIVIRLNSETQTPENLYRLSIPTQRGPLPLISLGRFELASSPTLITREDGRRTISVTAGVEQGFSISEINQKLETYADTLSLPQGYSWQTGGVNEENQNSVNSILQAMLLSFLLIVVTMVLQFSSFRKALIVMLVIPLSISGVFIIFALTNTPLSFPALIGVLALFGIVVKNSILVVDKIDQNLKAGLEFREAVADGASSRLEAITLTSLTAIAGLAPITLSDPLWRGLGGAIIAGLTFSGTIMLFFIPVVYTYWFEPKTLPVRKPVRRRGRQQKK